MSFIARRSFQVVRQTQARAGARRCVGDYKIAEKQAIYQANGHSHGADNPTYLKNGGGDKAYAIVGLAVTTLGTIWALGKHSNMAHGTGKIDG